VIHPDKLNSANPKAVGRGMMAAVTRLQDHPAEVQAHASALLFIALCAAHRVSAQDVMTAAKNLLDASKHAVPELRAAIDYVEQEIRS